MRRRHKPPSPVPAAVYSVREFCEAHRISKNQYYKLKRQGLGPREMQLGGKIVISLESAAAWRRAREAGS